MRCPFCRLHNYIICVKKKLKQDTSASTTERLPLFRPPVKGEIVNFFGVAHATQVVAGLV